MKRLNKSEAARKAGICRETIQRYAKKGQISTDEKGKVLLSEVLKVWNLPIVRVHPKFGKSHTPREKFIPLSL